jgi:hypothetical protein
LFNFVKVMVARDFPLSIFVINQTHLGPCLKF